MFQGCTGLTSAPMLPAATLVSGCYSYMFYGCTNLKYIKCLATNLGEQNDKNTYYWVSGVSETGTFVKAADVWSIGVDGIPSGWTVTTE